MRANIEAALDGLSARFDADKRLFHLLTNHLRLYKRLKEPVNEYQREKQHGLHNMRDGD